MSTTVTASGTAEAFDGVMLPFLREDLELLEGPATAEGAPTWTIHDPVRNRYFRIEWPAFEMLTRWSGSAPEGSGSAPEGSGSAPEGSGSAPEGSGSAPKALLARVRDETTLNPQPRDLEALVRFLLVNQLARPADGDPVQHYLRQHAASQRHWLRRWAEGYLFVRIPLIDPDRFLRRTLPVVEPLFSWQAAAVFMVIAIAGIVLTLRQWDAFATTFQHFFTLAGLLYYVIALLAVKVVHEFAHAYTARRFGCRVPTIGIALMVLFPVLYTDATATWRLASRRQRLAVGAAGITAELAVASIALLAWNFLPDGAVRSAMFFLATASWLVSLSVNLNPLMRFDGYYLLSDALGMANLQTRSFAMGRWRLRELLFGLGMPPPEALSRARRRFLFLFAWATWTYRLVVFLAIALLVYHLFFKLLGALLFVLEIGLLVAVPLVRELRVWWGLRARILSSARGLLGIVVLGGLIALLFVPWQTTVRFPATLEAAEHTALFARFPARIVEVRIRPGQSVAHHEALIVTEIPSLERDIAQARRRIAIIELRLERLAASATDRQALKVLLEELAAERTRLEGLERKSETLVIRAPFTAVVADMARSLHARRWIDNRSPLAVLLGPGGAVITGYARATDLARVDVAQPGTFIPEDITRAPVPVRVHKVDPVLNSRLDSPYLASVHGGPIAVREDASRGLVSEQAIVRVTLLPETRSQVPLQVLRGTVRIKAEPLDLAERFYRGAAAILIRELTF